MTLPTVGGGEDTWGTILNAHINVGHSASGSHNQTGLTAQVVNTQTGAVATGTTAIPYDDTIPQKTEGKEYMTLAITPKSATNKLKIDVVIFFHTNTTDHVTAALFQDSIANALAAGINERVASNVLTGGISFTHYMTAGTTSAITFKVRMGGKGSNTITFNGSNGARRYGGVMASSITITEIWV